MTRLIDFAAVQRLISMAECIDVVEAAFMDYAEGRAIIPARLRVDIPGAEGAGYFMAGYLNGRQGQAFGCKVVTGFRKNQEAGLPNVMGTLTLLDAETGRTLAIMDARYLTSIRTGASSGVAARHLAGKNASQGAILGLGEQALPQLQAMAAECRLTRIRAYSPTAAEKPEQLAAMSNTLGIPVEIAPSARAACEDADVIVLATTRDRPVIAGQWIKPGAFVSAIGYHTPQGGEVDGETFRRAGAIVCDDVEANLRESGDLMKAVEDGTIRRDRLIDLGDLVRGEAPGRRDETEIIVYKSIGNAFQDLAVALHVYRNACEQGIGTEFSFGNPGE
jgi:ornithine cyclodeaminase/alanine dehydrogenase-like protein (mu-crystallin family)